MRQSRPAALTVWLIAALAAVNAVYPAAGAIPDRSRTPGAADSLVTQDNIFRTICAPGWASSRRPPESVTEAIKRQQLAALGLPGGMAGYEEDHLIPLELGGAAADPRNLWPQPRHPSDGWTAGKKDRLEGALHARVCEGALPLSEAQRAIARDWTAAYAAYVGAAPPRREYRHRATPPAGDSPSECPGDLLVWVNVKTGVFHLPGTRWYGRTASGAFECERAAMAEGDHIAGNGQ